MRTDSQSIREPNNGSGYLPEDYACGPMYTIGSSPRGFKGSPYRWLRPGPSRQAARPYVYALPALGVKARFCRRPGDGLVSAGRLRVMR
jgi:hypothetical protein